MYMLSLYTNYILYHHHTYIIMYAGVLGSGQEASSKEALSFHQLVDEPQQIYQSVGRVL